MDIVPLLMQVCCVGEGKRPATPTVTLWHSPAALPAAAQPCDSPGCCVLSAHPVGSQLLLLVYCSCCAGPVNVSQP